MTSYPTFLEKLDTIIFNNLKNEDFSIEELSQLLCLSSSQVYRKIKQQTDLSPSCYIRRKRLEQAYYLINESDLSFSEISLLVGFNHLSYFSRCFSEQYGNTPSSFRR